MIIILLSHYIIRRFSPLVNILWTKLVYKYDITADGIIKFDFKKNNYWSIVWRGGQGLLAEAMYKQAKKINKKFLSGRTIGGLNIELQGHWAAYILTGHDRVATADMGALTKKAKGYDSNAWFWETGNAARIACKIYLCVTKGDFSIIRSIMRYM